MGEPLIVIGNGMAAARLVEELAKRALGRYAVAVIGEEPRLAYNRVLLSALLADEVGFAEIELKPAQWWRDRGVTLRYGMRASAVDPVERELTLSSGTRLSFSKLVFATGSQPIKLDVAGMDMPGVFTFRDIDDVKAIAKTAGKRVVVIGGGLLGLEAAHGLAKAGARVTVLHLMDRLMERQLDARAARMLKRAVEGRGIAVRLNAETGRIVGSDRVEGVELQGGRWRSRPMRSCRHRRQAKRRAGAKAGPHGQSRHRRRDASGNQPCPASTRSANAPSIAGICYGLVEPAYEQARVLAAAACRARSASYRGQRAGGQSEGLRRRRIIGRRFLGARPAPRRSC